MNTSTIPTYQAECSRSTNRGLLICIEGSTVAIGTLISSWIDFGASYGPPGLTWRFPIAFQIVFGLLIIGGMFVLPGSPRWLFIRERYEEGEAVIAALAAKTTDHPDVQLQRTIILDSIRAYVLIYATEHPRRSSNPKICFKMLIPKQFRSGGKEYPHVCRLHWRQDSALPSHAPRFIVTILPTNWWLQRCHLLPTRPIQPIPRSRRLPVNGSWRC